MAPRKPATAEELLALLEQFLAEPPQSYRKAVAPRAGAVAAPLDTFLIYAQAKLRTTAQNARTWVKNIAVADGAPFRIMRTSYGVFCWQLADHPEPRNLRRYQFTNWNCFNGFEYEAPPRLDAYGVPTDSATDRAEDVDFILPTNVLNNMIISTSARSDELKIEKAQARTAELDAADAAHGEGIALLRGLLHAANIPRRDSNFRVAYDEQFAHENSLVDMSTRVRIDLGGAQLDALAPVLRELGIKPRYRKKTGNAEPQPDRLPDGSGSVRQRS